MSVVTVNDLMALREKLASVQAEYDQACGKYADQVCPFSVGDVVRISHYSYAGRMMRVEEISLIYSRFKQSFCFRWVATGVVQKKNGGDSQLRTEIREGRYDPDHVFN